MSRDYLEIKTDAQSLLRIIIMKVVPSGSSKNIPWNERHPYKRCKRFHHGKESYHWFTPPRDISKTKPAERQEHSDFSPPKDAVQQKRYRARQNIVARKTRQTAQMSSKNDRTDVKKEVHKWTRPKSKNSNKELAVLKTECHIERQNWIKVRSNSIKIHWMVGHSQINE